jgi:hypothetical protein
VKFALKVAELSVPSVTAPLANSVGLVAPTKV